MDILHYSKIQVETRCVSIPKDDSYHSRSERFVRKS
jgi:hypothetical protein